MGNLMIAPQPAPANVESPKLNAHALPAGVKTAGKTAAQVKDEATATSDDFTAKLKEGLDNEAKKEEAKKAALSAAVLAQTQVQASEIKPDAKGEGKAEVKADAKLDPKAAALAKTGIKGEVVDPRIAAANEKAQAAENAKTAGQTADAAQKTAVKDNLNPTQQAMLQQTQLSAGKGAVTAAALPQALQALNAQPELEQEFEVEGLSLKDAAKEKAASDLFGKDELSAKRTPASKVSTSDFLSLRDLSKPGANNPAMLAAGSQLDLGTALKGKSDKKDKLESLHGREAFTGMMANQLGNAGHGGKVIDAPVTQGSAGKAILSHDAIHQMTQQVNLLSKAQQDGEIKIRLRPDHLGELSMSVKAQGQQVSIEIKAQNGESKKIIEESLATLKDSLAQQNLTLGRVDIVTAPAHAQNAADQGMQMDMSQFRQNSGQNSGNSFDDGASRQDRLYEEMNAPVNLNTVRRSAQGAARVGGQGLDLIA